ncbi:hypothetical protein J3E68DRAFT_415971 [Trichoderma sp. SZMC 28012]
MASANIQAEPSDIAGTADTTIPMLSCLACRVRKLKCNRARPACARCVELGRDCAYPKRKRKPSDRKGLKGLETRLEQLEKNLNELEYSDDEIPPLKVQEELNRTFFSNQYHAIPVVHPGRYYEACYSEPSRRPPWCLQYAIWALGANGHSIYDSHALALYEKARKYAEEDEMKGQGEHFISVAHVQTWLLLATFESNTMLFTRASVSLAKTTRLAQMMGLDRLDGASDGARVVLPPPASWCELEERRRVFWGAFAIDSHASLATGWSCLIDPNSIRTRLPASERAFSEGNEEIVPFLDEISKGGSYDDFASTLVTLQVYRNILQHILCQTQREQVDTSPDSFWIRHYRLDDRLSRIISNLPISLVLPLNVTNMHAIQLNCNLRAAYICLHHAVIENQSGTLPPTVRQSSLDRLKTSATDIVNTLKLVPHSIVNLKDHLSTMPLYLASTVYVLQAKMDPETGLNATDASDLEFLINSMEAISQTHKVSRVFLQQTYLDICTNRLESCIGIPDLSKYHGMFLNAKSSVPFVARTMLSGRSEILNSSIPDLAFQIPSGWDIWPELADIIGAEYF